MQIEVMNYVISGLKDSGTEKVVMVGDTKYDADGAAQTGCGFIGCLFGYGTKEEMEEHYTTGTPLFAKNPSDIASMILC